MPKETIPFELFIEAAGPTHTDFIVNMDACLRESDCVCEIKQAKSGYVVSYIHKPTNRTVVNYVFRKKGPLLRIYADFIGAYMEVLDEWPESMKKAVEKAGPCKRMLNPDACNPRCVMGFDFVMEGKRQQKCRYGGFMFYLEDETKPYLADMVRREIKARSN